MAIYSYYYGASAGSGIGIRAMSQQLGNLAIRSDLKELASLHALESTNHDSEMLSYLLQRDGFNILGISYIESPKSSGYSRSAQCSLQYVIPDGEMKNASPDLGGIVNFINFQKPASAAPAPLNYFPLNESGYSYHNNSAVLAEIVDGLVRVALSTQHEVLLIALPKGKSNEYATARYTIAEALNYLPIPLRQNIHFFTGLPVGEGVTDARTGYDNAVKYNANVIFCPNEHYERLRGYRSFIGIDMDRPAGMVGAFASYMAQTLTPAKNLSQIDCCLSGALTYDSLNQAAQRVQRGDVMSVDRLKAELDRSEKRYNDLELSYSKQYQELYNLQNAYNSLQDQQRYVQEPTYRDPPPRRRKGVLFWILWVLIVLALMAASAMTAWIVSSYHYTGHFFLVNKTTTAVSDNTDVTAAPKEEPTVTVTPEPQPTNTATPEPQPTDTVPPETQPAAIATPDTTAVTPNATDVSEETALPKWTEARPTPMLETTYSINTDSVPQATVDQGGKTFPVINNCYGVTNVGNLNLRSGKGTDSDALRTGINKDVKVWMVKTELNEEGQQWTEVYVNGQHGYIKSEYLTIMSQEESDAYNSQQPSPVPESMYGSTSFVDAAED